MPDAQVQIDSLKEDVRSISDTVAMILEKVTRHDGRLDRLETRFEARFAEYDGRFDRIEGRITEHDGRFDRIDGLLAEVLRRLPEPH